MTMMGACGFQVWLKKKGLASADKKAGRIAAEGVVASYIHAGSSLGVLIEVNCETDFVAKGEVLQELAADMAMQVRMLFPFSGNGFHGILNRVKYSIP